MMPDSPAGYEDRVCAFLDILGFKELIERSGADQSIFDKIRTALDEVERTRLEWDAWSIKFNGEPIPQTLRSHTFSDSILVSDAGRGGLFSLLKAVAEICVLLFDAGILTRGGIARGKLYHTRSAAFGKAFVDAYLLENRVAKSPRILVTDPVRAAASLEFIEVNGGGNFRVPQFLAIDGDGLTYFDWLSLVLSFPAMFPMREAASREMVRTMLESGKRRVLRDLNSAYDYDVQSKLGWFVRYFSATVARFDYVADLVVKPIPRSYANLPLPEWDDGVKKA